MATIPVEVLQEYVWPRVHQLQLLLHGLHCTLDGAYWQPTRASGRLTVCSDFCALPISWCPIRAHAC